NQAHAGLKSVKALLSEYRLRLDPQLSRSARTTFVTHYFRDEVEVMAFDFLDAQSERDEAGDDCSRASAKNHVKIRPQRFIQVSLELLQDSQSVDTLRSAAVERQEAERVSTQVDLCSGHELFHRFMISLMNVRAAGSFHW